MSAFILLPFAATTQNLSQPTDPLPSSEQAKKNDCIEMAALSIEVYCSFLSTPISSPLSLLSAESFRNTLISLVMS
ncbi:hypothetical protein TrRE_jg591, partial [Triparma retinervis]